MRRRETPAPEREGVGREGKKGRARAEAEEGRRKIWRAGKAEKKGEREITEEEKGGSGPGPFTGISLFPPAQVRADQTTAACPRADFQAKGM